MFWKRRILVLASPRGVRFMQVADRSSSEGQKQMSKEVKGI